jgi:hypothetical protein
MNEAAEWEKSKLSCYGESDIKNLMLRKVKLILGARAELFFLFFVVGNPINISSSPSVGRHFAFIHFFK